MTRWFTVTITVRVSQYWSQYNTCNTISYIESLSLCLPVMSGAVRADIDNKVRVKCEQVHQLCSKQQIYQTPPPPQTAEHSWENSDRGLPDIIVVINGVWPAVPGGMAEISAALSVEAWYCRQSCIENSRYWGGWIWLWLGCLVISKSAEESLTWLGEMSKQLTGDLGGAELSAGNGNIDWFDVWLKLFISLFIAIHLFLFRYVIVLLGAWLNNANAQGLIWYKLCT